MSFEARLIILIAMSIGLIFIYVKWVYKMLIELGNTWISTLSRTFKTDYEEKKPLRTIFYLQSRLLIVGLNFMFWFVAIATTLSVFIISKPG